jgi:2-(1,2-epoxy-1,2-dihydrophenyl)acetyl-CoA isomerase
MPYETVNLRIADGAARIVLNRPDSLNAWNERFGRELLDAVESVSGDEAVRAVLITGAGRAFSSGADLREQRAGVDGEPPDLSQRLRELYNPVILGVREMPKPVLAAVNGPAVGIGCSLALACDLVLAAESAYFLLAFVNIGLVPDGGSSVFIPARAGAGRAAEMALLGERVPAATGRAWGLVDRLVTDDSFAAEVDALAERLATGPTRAYAAAKEQLNARAYRGLDEQLELEASLQQELAGSADFGEGVLAFLEKRSPRFTGE